MVDQIKKAMFASIGLAYVTAEKVQELGKKIVNEAKLSEDEGRKFVEDLQARATEARTAASAFVAKQVQETMRKLDLPTRAEVAELKQKIADLEAKVRG